MSDTLRRYCLQIGVLITNLILANAPSVRGETFPQPSSASERLDLPPEILENSPVLQRWLKEIPNILEGIKHDPSFRTRIRLGYSQFPSNRQVGGFSIGVEDIFIGGTGLTMSGSYLGSFNGDRKLASADLHYYVLPLGSYINLAPVVGYRYVKSENYSTNGVNIGARLMLSLSRTGAADISLTQSFVSPGGHNEVGITTLSVGYAITPHLRLAADLQQQNSIAAKDNQFGILLEWMP